MKNLLLAFVLLGVGAAVAPADENNLTDGVFICHHDPNLIGTPPYDWCQYYIDGYKIEDCESQNPMINTSDQRVWFLLSAWPEVKTWCGTEFGLGDYDPYCYIFTSFGPCTPGGNLEIPTDYWPGPGEGTAIVTTDLAWHGNWEPVYYFMGYSYYGDCQVPFDVDPPTGFGGWGNCEVPPQPFDATCFPAMGILMEGVECCPPDIPIAVCCVGEECFLTDEDECDALGGEFHPEWDTCEPNPCLPSPAENTRWGTIKAIYR
jgi:hypothetical protein